MVIILFAVFSGDEQQGPPEFFINQINPEESSPASGIFRYDAETKELFVEDEPSWQSSNFTRYIFDSAGQDSELAACSYFIYDAGQELVVEGGTRECNAPLAVGVGAKRACSSEGEDVCLLYARAEDVTGRAGEYAIASYHIDYEAPQVGRPYITDETAKEVFVQFGEEEEYQVRVSDNLSIGACQLYVDRKAVSPMAISSCSNGECIVQASYIIESGEEHIMSAACGDQYALQQGRYLNTAAGESLVIRVLVNHIPEIASCRVIPTSGTTSTVFSFNADVSDPDEEELSFLWDFGNGETSTTENPSYQYRISGTFMPKVQVNDQSDAVAECTTAWVVVE